MHTEQEQVIDIYRHYPYTVHLHYASTAMAFWLASRDALAFRPGAMWTFHNHGVSWVEFVVDPAIILEPVCWRRFAMTWAYA